MLYSPTELIRDAEKKQYAIAAFNFYNLDTLMAVLSAAEEERSPLIVQIYSAHFLHYNGGGIITKAALEAIRACQIPVALHLDHASDYDCIVAAMDFGFNSVMYDGSLLPFEENLFNTTRVVKEARARGIYTEAELGKIVRSDSEGFETFDEYTQAADAKRFVEESGADSLAPSIGTAHGMYKSTPKLNFQRLAEIHAAVSVPLVLHGGSGIPDEMVQKSITLGVKKVNIGTELKRSWIGAIKDELNRGQAEPIALAAIARDAAKEIARSKIRLLGSNGKA